MAAIGTFLPCQPRRAMSVIGGRPADKCSMRVLRILTHLCHSTINFAVMHNAHSYNDVVGYDPRAEGAYEAARVHHSARRRGRGMAARGTGAAAK